MKPQHKVVSAGYIKPRCKCGNCTIKIQEHDDEWEKVESGQYTTMKFHNVNAEICDDDDDLVNECEVVSLETPQANRKVLKQYQTIEDLEDYTDDG